MTIADVRPWLLALLWLLVFGGVVRAGLWLFIPQQAGREAGRRRDRLSDRACSRIILDAEQLTPAHLSDMAEYLTALHDMRRRAGYVTELHDMRRRAGQ